MVRVNNTDRLDTLVCEIKSLEDKITTLVSGGTNTPESELRALDKSLVRQMEHLYEYRVESAEQLLTKTRFLLDRVRLLSEPDGMTKFLTDKVEDELASFVTLSGAFVSSSGAHNHMDSDQTNTLIEVCYSSNAQPDFSESEMESLCQTATNNNMRDNITGLLTYDPRNGKFYQVLEGDHHTLWKLMNLIITDNRHSDIVVHHQSSIDDRAFGKWSMRYLGGSEMSSDIRNLDDWFEALLSEGRGSIGQAWIFVILKRIYSQAI